MIPITLNDTGEALWFGMTCLAHVMGPYLAMYGPPDKRDIAAMPGRAWCKLVVDVDKKFDDLGLVRGNAVHEDQFLDRPDAGQNLDVHPDFIRDNLKAYQDKRAAEPKQTNKRKAKRK